MTIYFIPQLTVTIYLLEVLLVISKLTNSREIDKLLLSNWYRRPKKSNLKWARDILIPRNLRSNQTVI
jgi:hypothetical protein